MTTTVVKTIGTSSRDYSTIAAWEAAAPASLVAVDEIWQGECYNDSEFLVTSGISISGITVDSTRYVRLTAASGQSFADNASKLTNALAYNQSNGVGIRTATNYVVLLTISVDYTHFDRLQISRAASLGTDHVISAVSRTGLQFSQSIVDTIGSTGTYCLAINSNTGSTAVNSLILTRGTSSGINASYSSGTPGIYNCTVVKTSDKSGGTGIFNAGGGFSNLTVENCAVFGFTTTGSSGTYHAGSDYNAVTDATSPFGGTHNQTSLTYASQFHTITPNTSADYRALSTGSLGNGTPDSTHTGGVDIVGQTRSSTTPYIGAWEVVSTVSFLPRQGLNVNQAVNRASTF